MSLNFAFGFSLILILLVVLNIYFFYSLNGADKRPKTFNLPSVKSEQIPSIFKEVFDYLNYLPNKYKNKNTKFYTIRKNLVTSFNSTNNNNLESAWDYTDKWTNEASLFPHDNGMPGRLVHAIQKTPIILVDNAHKGTQLKLALLLEGNRKLYFKPKRYEIDKVINGVIYSGFDRHNSEVFAYYLAMVMNYTWVAPAAIRRLHIARDIIPVVTPALKKTMTKNGSGSYCIYGKCFFCRTNETVCPDNNGEIEGAAILYLNRQFRIYKYPWRRSYTTRKMDWEKDNDFCKRVIMTMSTKRLLNLIDVAIFDFLIQNGDRHAYEVYKDKVVLVDNGKGLGNPSVDELDILAPLYQCCMLHASTWQHLELLSGGSLTEAIKVLASFQGEVLATEDHFKAVERRLLKLYATIQYCIGKHGSSKVFKIGF